MPHGEPCGPQGIWREKWADIARHSASAFSEAALQTAGMFQAVCQAQGVQQEHNMVTAVEKLIVWYVCETQGPQETLLAAVLPENLS